MTQYMPATQCPTCAAPMGGVECPPGPGMPGPGDPALCWTCGVVLRFTDGMGVALMQPDQWNSLTPENRQRIIALGESRHREMDQYSYVQAG